MKFFLKQGCGKGNKDTSQGAAASVHRPVEEGACLHSPSLPGVTVPADPPAVGLCGCSLISFIRVS